ncbi:LVIVD repeat-containing protein [Arundinibacter roseus]|uniref:LVIVD repeat-containing protein n=1 Tax=Arundinibacter roseus TaxID=2070510 RepID=A0A4V2XAM7_9BACT|nr:hypothetical protein [Arundinibacter roseus]TDB68165.1 hypothetical protein EZE20_04370 [Arundinibacter roseus]
MKTFSLITFVGLLLFCIACTPRETGEPPNGPAFNGTAYVPVYATAADLDKVETLPARALKAPGKIYIKDTYLFVNEQGEGIHIIDNRDPASPEKISFVSILGNYDMAVKGNFLYADNARDLIVLDISNPLKIKVVKRIPSAIPQNNYPPYTNIYFECVDSEKGAVVGWEKVNMDERPACFR